MTTRGRQAALAVLALLLLLAVPTSHPDSRTPSLSAAVLDQQVPTGRWVLRVQDPQQQSAPHPDAITATSTAAAPVRVVPRARAEAPTSTVRTRPARVRGPPVG